jgi:PAS domain S-box-containing protein
MGMEVNDNLLMGFLEAAPDAMLVVNSQRVILLANSQAEMLFGYGKGALNGQSLDILLPDSMRETHARHVEKFVQDPSKRRMNTGYDFTGQRSDGSQIQVEINLTHVDMHGEVVAIAAIRDVEPRRRAEAQLRKLMRAVEQSASMIVMCDPLGNIEYVNPKFTQVTGYAYDEVMGKNPRLLKADNSTSDAHHEMWDMLISGQEWRGEFHNRKKNNETYWVSVSISPVLDADGQIVHYIAVQEDITERKRIEEAEREQRALVEALRDTSAIINATLDVREVMDRILNHLGNILPYDTAELLLIEGSVASVEQARGQHGYHAKQIGEFFIPLDQPSNLRTMIDTGRPMVIPNVRDYEHWITPPGGEWVMWARRSRSTIR